PRHLRYLHSFPTRRSSDLATTGDTLCDEKDPVILERMEFPEPVISVAIEPKTKADQQKLGEALARLAAEDPSFRAHTDEETGQTDRKSTRLNSSHVKISYA